MRASFDSRKIGERALISGENRPMRGQGGGCDHKIMSTPRAALLADKDEKLGVGVGDL